MARVSTYLNFMGNTEEAFNFYRTVFRTEFVGPIQRMGDVPPGPGGPEISPAEKNNVVHVALPITGGHVLMGTDTPEAMGKLTFGNNISLNLEPDTREEAERLFAALSVGGRITMPLQDMFWGALYGALDDKFGVSWMVNCSAPKP
jgi:PhnB protein